MSLSDAALRFGNELYKFAFPVYRPIYKAFKIVSDQAERELLARYAKPGSVVVDGGANIGIYSESPCSLCRSHRNGAQLRARFDEL